MSDLKSTGQQTADAPTPDDALHEAASLAARERAQAHGSAADDGPVLSADGTPLKRSLARALRMQKLRALALIAPLLIFILLTFIAPIADMLFRSVENQIVSETIPETVVALADWDSEGGSPPAEPVFDALYVDLFIAEEQKLHTRLGTRLNYEKTGISSLFRKSGRRVGRFDTDSYTDQITALDETWKDPATWVAMMQSDANRAALPFTARSWDRWTAYLVSEGDDPAKEKIEDFLFTTLFLDLRETGGNGATDPRIAKVAAALDGFETVTLSEQFAKADKDWLDPEVWGTIKAFAPPYTGGYFLNAIDMQKTPHGIEARPENQRIYMTLFKRTIFMSIMITLSCALLGYPVAWILANLPSRTANLLMILVLLPFWTSLLVRTSAWKVMLQQQGVINDTLVWLGLVADDARLVMINNQFGTIVAMTHILLPFMILPLYSVMQTIQPTYLRAAKSLGATNWTAFWRVYFPQSVPGIGAGSILVFILSIGYYITPEIVGGNTGTFISNRIAYHISSSLNWGLAAALGSILLAVVMGLYWVYDKIVGIDNVKLG
ncbi:ABC transporter permease [Aquicoccus sp. SU-CL01552]|uniref:ABC transporter permease n=1 Tax=Aquicoccus sp. SU-CL01552 TaxID=3127656 RepID=UPI003106CFD7